MGDNRKHLPNFHSLCISLLGYHLLATYSEPGHYFVIKFYVPSAERNILGKENDHVQYPLEVSEKPATGDQKCQNILCGYVHKA